jgi:hypothetical protein
MYCKVWRPNTSLLKISGAIALHNNKRDLKTSGVTAQDNKHQLSKSIFHLNCQLYAAKYMAKPFCLYSQLRTCSFHSLKYIEIHWNNKGEFSALMTQVVNLKLIKLNLMLLIRNRCLPSNSNVFGFSRKEAWKGLGNTKKGAGNVHHSSYMASTPIRSTTTTHRWGCLHPLEKMQEEE